MEAERAEHESLDEGAELVVVGERGDRRRDRTPLPGRTRDHGSGATVVPGRACPEPDQHDLFDRGLVILAGSEQLEGHDLAG